MFCPGCGDEFRPGFSVCPDCEVPLVEQLPAKDAVDAEDELVTIATFRDPFEASLARGALEAAGVAASVPGESEGTFSRRGVTGLTELQVSPGDRDRAVEILKDLGHR